tara:strand:+ start:350 stop:559 length:210 start_codon:yes stop_codon:yes gene_type:complete
MGALKRLLSSKRFIAAVLAIIVLVLVDVLGFAEEQAQVLAERVIQVTLALIGSFTATDVVLAVKGEKKE